MVALEPRQEGSSHCDLYWLSLILTHLNESVRNLDLAFGPMLTDSEGWGMRERLRISLSQLYYQGSSDAGSVHLQLLEESRLVLEALKRKEGGATESKDWQHWQAQLLDKWVFEDEVLNLDRDFSMSCSQGNLTEIQRIAEVLPNEKMPKLKISKGVC